MKAWEVCMVEEFHPIGGVMTSIVFRDIERRYVDEFGRLGSEAVKDYRCLIASIRRFHDRLLNDWVYPLIKRMDYYRMRVIVYEFCKHYSRFLGSSLMERLEYDLYEVLEDDLRAWNRRRRGYYEFGR